MTESTPPAEGARTEPESLRTEVVRRRAGGAPSGGQGVPDGGATAAKAGRRRWGRLRWTATGVLVVLTALLALSSVAARYVRGQLLDTDRYVSTVAPLADDPAVQDAVAARVTDALVEQLDLETLTRDALTALADSAPRVPDAIVGLAPVLAGEANGFIGDQVTRFVRSDAFVTLWAQANRAAHANVVAVLTGGGGGALTATRDGAVVLDLGPVVAAVEQRLVARGLTFAGNLPQVSATITVFQSSALAKAQRWTRALDRLATWLPWIALVVAAAAVALAPPRRRRRAVVVVASAVAVGMIALGLGVTVARAVYLGAVPAHVLPPGAAAVVFDTVVQPLRGTLRPVLVVALVVALASFLGGPGSVARGVRDRLMRGTSPRVSRRPAG